MSGFGVTSPYEISNGDRHIKIGFSGYMTNRYGKLEGFLLLSINENMETVKEMCCPFFRKSFKTEEILNAMQKAFDEEGKVNKFILQLFSDFKVDGVSIPFKFLRYDGELTTYVTFMEVGKDGGLYADDQVQSKILTYDFDIYSKGNYLSIIDESRIF